jgi:hypothetical protein
MRKIVRSFLIGIGYGSIIYILSLYVQNVEIQTLSNITSVVLISGLIGVCSLIFTTDFLNFKWQLVLHFFIVLSLIIAMNVYNGFTGQFLTFGFLGGFVLVYLVVWSLMIYITHEKVERINKKLQQRKKNKS